MKLYHLTLAFLLISSSIVYSKDIDPGLPGGDPDVPLDGGVGILLFAGAVYGVKKINQSKQ